MTKNLNGLLKFATAGMMYTGFAVYLYQPYFNRFKPLQYLLVVNVCLAALGCFVLSRRWVASFWGSLFAGAIYGFGPFALGLAKFHPTAGLLASAIPWLFLPAALWPKRKWRWLNWPLCAIPFLAILLFFELSAHYRLFTIPIQTRLRLADLSGLLAPTVSAEQSSTLVGFYQVPIAAMAMGFSILLAARRFGIIMIFAVGTILAFCHSFFNISPIIWLAIPVLCCSVLVGTGMQGLVLASSSDRKWVLATAIIMAAASIVMLLMATKYFQIFAGLGDKYAKLLTETAKMYILGAVAVTIIFFMARANSRIHWLRQIVLCSAMAIDILLGARFIVDKIF